MLCAPRKSEVSPSARTAAELLINLAPRGARTRRAAGRSARDGAHILRGLTQKGGGSVCGIRLS